MRTWDPYKSLDDLRQEIDHVFNGWRTGFGSLPRLAFLPGEASRIYPRVNLYEDKNTVWIEALAPGVNPESLDVSVEGNAVIISGTKTPACSPEKREAYHRCERAAGKFRRNVSLDVEVDPEQITAHYKNGLLLIELPKHEKAKPKSINVSIG